METDLLRALRTYINKSKRKRLSKRETAKMVVMELVNTVKITLPDDLSEALDSLDDEQMEMQKPAGELTIVPAELAGSELWEKVQEAGLVDADGQPTVSRTEAALLADELAERLDISHKWKLFETFWHRNNMRGDYNTALEQKKSLVFQEKLKKLLG